MADNVGVTPGTGATFATDDIGGIQYPRVKLTQGADGSATDVSTAAPLQVTLANGTVPSHAVTNAGTFAVQATLAAETTKVIGTVNIASAQTLGTVTTVGAVTAITNALPAGTNNIGDVDVLTIGGQTPAFGSGTVSSSTLRVALPTDQQNANGQATMANSSPVVLASDQSSVPTTPAGGVAHDGADSGNPIKIGARARSSEIAAVANNDRSDLITDLVGKLITLPYANPENFVSGAITTAMTGTTSTSLVAAPGSGLRNYITQITVSNSHATVGTDINIQDGSGGTVLYVIPAAAAYGGAVITFPTPLRQPTANTALFCVNVTTGSSTKVSASGYKGA